MHNIITMCQVALLFELRALYLRNCVGVNTDYGTLAITLFKLTSLQLYCSTDDPYTAVAMDSFVFPSHRDS